MRKLTTAAVCFALTIYVGPLSVLAAQNRLAGPTVANPASSFLGLKGAARECASNHRKYPFGCEPRCFHGDGCAEPLTRDEVEGDWDRKPSDAELAAAYPKNALTDGFAFLDCMYNDEAYQLYDCNIVREWPLNQGFGAAALSVVDKYRVKKGTLQYPVFKGIIVFPVLFDAPGSRR